MNNLPKAMYLNPLIMFFIGMAGSGKTTLVHRISIDLSFIKKNHYIINLDPAAIACPYTPNIDIRDTIDYKKIMKDYFLGPNGAILTSLNLFSTRFSQIKNIIEANETRFDYILIDTPGQIEVFTWSASGSILCESFSANYPTVNLFIIDLSRSINPMTFVSNVLYSCGILYRTKIPTFIIINKKDITSIDFIREWLDDFESFDHSLVKENFFAGSFARSLALTLDNFYKKTFFLGVSAFSGVGTFRLFNVIKKIIYEFKIQFQANLEKFLSQKISYINKIVFKKNEIFKKKKDAGESDILDYLDILDFLTTLKIENDKIYIIGIK
jgi:GTPase SAR1 family protein